MLTLEGGADAATALLRSYDPATRRWSVERSGEFWDAVHMAHQLGRRGRGRRIAVIDDGFDLGIPALAEHTLAWPASEPTTTSHGSVVALLILEVAPEATLTLYPTRLAGRLDPGLLCRAVEHATEAGAEVINLSLGEAFPYDEVIDLDRPLIGAEPWPGPTAGDLPFWQFAQFADPAAWATAARVPPTALGDAATAASAAGVTVVAAAGNSRDHVFSPALEQAVLGVGFQRVARSHDEGPMEVARARPPSFGQTRWADLHVQQPVRVLGSSFASPLLAGLALLMPGPTGLGDYVEAVRLTAMADVLLPTLDDGGTAASRRRHEVVGRLYEQALAAAPHDHTSDPTCPPCPECSLLLVATYVNGGLHRLNWGDLDGAERLLGPAVAFAPSNPHGVSALAMALTLRAHRLLRADPHQDVSTLLTRARELWTRATELRPDELPYRRRLDEVTEALRDPSIWLLQP